jgi:hypothetical protein
MAPSSTPVGIIGVKDNAAVDPRGLVTPRRGGWSLDWWVGADDRWHFPAREAGVRQRLVDGTPVVETAMRVPGGDIVERVYAVPGRTGGTLVVVEVENQTPTPVALALSIRPYNPDGLAVVRSIARDGSTVTVDGCPAMVFPRDPAHEAGSTFSQGDVADVVTAGQAGKALPSPLRCDQGQAQAAFLFPLPHRSTLRFGLPLGPAAAASGRTLGRRRRRHSSMPELPAAVPSAAAVAKGWRALDDRGLRLHLPAGRLAEAIEANRRYLLLLHNGDDVVPGSVAEVLVAALDRQGFHREAAEILRSFSRRQRRQGAVRRAMAEHWRLTGDDDLMAELAPSVLREPIDSQMDGSQVVGNIDGLVETTTATYTWPDDADRRVAVADFLNRARDLLVRETPEGLDLCSKLPPSWLGQPLEVHDAPTYHGVVSFALRWHGDRPALLWERTLRPGSRPDLVLRAPGLDPSWSTTAPQGEALLGAQPSVVT